MLLAERFLLYRKAISYKVKNPKNHNLLSAMILRIIYFFTKIYFFSFFFKDGI